MLFTDASLYDKMLELVNSRRKPAVWNWTAHFIVDNMTLPAVNVLKVERISDFVTAHSDLLVLELHITHSLYNKHLLPNKDNLKIKIVKYQQNLTGNTDRIVPSYSQIFNAFLTDASSSKAMSTSNTTEDDRTNDLSGYANIHVQAVDVALYEFRLHEVAGVYKDVTMNTLIKGLMSHPLKVLNGKSTPVDMVDSDNKEVFYQKIIPSGLRLIDLPTFAQKKYGVYATGMGNFLQNGQWYIFPLLNYKRFNTTTRTLTILNVPPKDMLTSDTSYILEKDKLFVFSSGGGGHIDMSEHVLNKNGRGFRYAINSNLIDNYRDVEGDTVKIPEGRNHVEVAGDITKTKLTNIKATDRLLSDNPFKSMSDIAAGMSSQMLLRWEFANPELLYPGMPTKILYKDKGVVKAILGTLIKVHSNAESDLQNESDKKYISVCEMTILCQRIT